MGGTLFDDLAGNLLDEGFPIRRWDVSLIGDFLANSMLVVEVGV